MERARATGPEMLRCVVGGISVEVADLRSVAAGDPQHLKSPHGKGEAGLRRNVVVKAPMPLTLI